MRTDRKVRTHRGPSYCVVGPDGILHGLLRVCGSERSQPSS